MRFFISLSSIFEKSEDVSGRMGAWEVTQCRATICRFSRDIIVLYNIAINYDVMTIMDSWYSLNKSNTENILLKLVLVFTLLFAIFHVSQHDLIEEDGGHLQSDCQVCRLAHLHGATPPVVAMITPLFVCLGTLSFIANPFSSRVRVYSWNARAPPSL